MKKVIVILGLIFSSTTAYAEMISSDAIGNDPAKVKLCAARAKVKPVPFEIDSRYVESARATHPDITFIAGGGGYNQLIECYLREGTGKYEPASMSPEGIYWHLPRPKQFSPGLSTLQGRDMAAKACTDAAEEKSTRPGFDHSSASLVVEIVERNPRYHPGAIIAGKKADNYDIAVEGESFYKSSGPDLAAVNFKCLLSPMLDVKAVQLK